jgi:uncharacterized protein (DUF1778 family)
MTDSSKRATVYFDSKLHRALRMKAADTHRSISDLVNEAVRRALQEDRTAYPVEIYSEARIREFDEVNEVPDAVQERAYRRVSETERITTTPRGYQDILDALINPPEPKAALVAAMREYEQAGIEWR